MTRRMVGLFMHIKIKNAAKGMSPITIPMAGFMLRAVHRHKNSPIMKLARTWPVWVIFIPFAIIIYFLLCSMAVNPS